MASEVLGEDEVRRRLEESGSPWHLDAGALVKEVKGRDFAAALAFVNKVGAEAERANHHPDISISWNKVELRLVTHSAGGITPKDLSMAERIDRLGPPER